LIKEMGALFACIVFGFYFYINFFITNEITKEIKK